MKIHRVSPKQLLNVIDFRVPMGLFLAKERDCWVAVDNTTGDAWTEDFVWKHQAIRWLHGNFEVSDRAALVQPPSVPVGSSAYHSGCYRAENPETNGDLLF